MKNKMIEPKIGEIIKLNEKRYMCEKDEPNTIGCFDCDMPKRYTEKVKQLNENKDAKDTIQ